MIAIGEIDLWLGSSMDPSGMQKPTNERNQNRIKVGERVTLIKRGKRGIWQMHFHYQGHRVISTKTAKLKHARKQAIVIASQLIQGTYGEEERQKPNPSKTNRMRISAARERYSSKLKREGKRKKTLAKYDGILEKLESYCKQHGIEMLDQVSVAVFDDYQESQQEQIEFATSEYEGGQIKRFLKWCVIREFIEENPLEAMTFKKVTNKKTTVLKLDQVNNVLETASALRRYIFALLAFTGMRISEAQHLLRKDVDLENGWINVVSRSGFETKSGNSWRVPIHPRLQKILLEREWPQKGWFFTALPSKKFPAGGHYVNSRTINDDFKKELEKQGILTGRKDGGFTLHCLRHFFKTFCIVEGKIPGPVVDFWQDHSPDKRRASNLYLHLTEEASKKLMNSVPFDE